MHEITAVMSGIASVLPCKPMHASIHEHAVQDTGIQDINYFLNHIWTRSAGGNQHATQQDWERVLLYLVRMQLRNRTPLLCTRIYTGVRWLRLRFTLCPRPLLDFVQIGLFASPELPISSQRHQRREGMLTSEQSQSARVGRGETSEFQHCLHWYETYNPPGPPFTPPPSPCTLLYVGVGALGAPLHWWSPSLYKLPACNVTPPDLRTPDIWARDGFSSSRLSQSPTRRKDPSSLRSATWARRCGGTAGGNSGEAGERRRAVVLWTCAEMTHMWTRLNSFGKEPHNFLNFHRCQHFQKLRKSPQY